MQIIKAISRTSDVLSKESQPFDFKNPTFDPEEFTTDLAKIMVDANGLGLSAIQVGIPYRVFVVRTDPVVVAYNPKIVGSGNEYTLAEEGCLSFPELYVKVKRLDEIRLRFQIHNGKFHTQSFAGMAARIVQHELDHLDGVLFFNRASHFHRDRPLEKWEKQIRKLNKAKG